MNATVRCFGVRGLGVSDVRLCDYSAFAAAFGAVAEYVAFVLSRA